MKKLLMALVALSTVGVGTQSAHARVIQCPVNDLAPTINEELPRRWSSNILSLDLVDTDIRKVNGSEDKMLVCEYGRRGRIIATISRPIPNRQACTVTDNGFDCNVVEEPSSGQSATLQVPQGFRADLDRAAIGVGSGMDIHFRRSGSTQELRPINGASMRVTNRRRGEAGCRRLRKRTTAVRRSSIPNGSFICVETSDGRIAEIQVQNWGSRIFPVLNMNYTIWNR